MGVVAHFASRHSLRPCPKGIDVHRSATEVVGGWILNRILLMLGNVGVPYGSRTRVAAVKEKRPIVIQRNFAAWIALYRT